MVKMGQGAWTYSCFVPLGSHAELVDRKMIDEGAAVEHWVAIDCPAVADWGDVVADWDGMCSCGGRS
jgi:hypothetical protein